MAASQKTNFAQDVASVMQKIADVTQESEENRRGNIYSDEQKIALEEARSCIERLLTEYNQVQLDRDVIMQEAFASTEFYEEELQKDKECIHELERKLEQKEEEIVSLQREWQQKIQEQAMTMVKEKAEIINQLHAAQEELSSLHFFRDHQLEIEGELEKAKKHLIEQREKEQQHLVELERKYIEQSNHLKGDYEKSLEDIRIQLEEEIEERVGTKIMHILQDNERLQEELGMHVEVTNGLQKEKSALQMEGAKLARDLDLLRQAEALHLQRSSSQARCISENNNKLQQLEKNLGQIIRQYSTERRSLEEEHKKRVAALQTEKQALKRLAQTKITELKRVRQLAQQVLRERGEVEAFLIDSLHLVADQIRNSRKSPAKKAHSHSNPKSNSNFTSPCHPPRNPPLSSLEGRGASSLRVFSSPSSIPQLPSVWASSTTTSSWPGAVGCTPPSPSSSRYMRNSHNMSTGTAVLEGQVMKRRSFDGGIDRRHYHNHVPSTILKSLEDVPVKMNPKVDISELTWDEREKVLRYLFQKIHTAHQISADAAQQQGYELIFGPDGDDGRTLLH